MVKLGSRIPLWRFTLVLAVPTIVAVLLAHYFSPQQKGALGLAYLFVVAVIGAGVGWLEGLLASTVVTAERALSVEPLGPLGTDDPRDLESLIVIIAVGCAAVLAAGHVLSVKQGGSLRIYDPRDLEFLILFLVVAFAMSVVSSMRRRQLERTNKRLENEIAERSRVDQDLEAHRDQLQNQARLLDLANDAILGFDVADARIQYWNEGAEKLYGWGKDDALGKHVHSFLGTVFPKLLPEAERALLERGNWEGELVHTKRDGTQVHVASRWTFQHGGNRQVLAVLEINRDITEKRMAERELQRAYAELEIRIKERTAELARTNEELHESERYLRELSAQLMQAEDDERRRIGRELHDSAGQDLAALIINLHLLRSEVSPKDDAAETRFRECVKIADGCATEIRTLSYLMYPPMLDDFGLLRAIPFCVNGFDRRSGIRTTVELPSNLDRLSRDLELAIFRILQESLTNIQRHSNATTASVRLLMTEGRVILEVKDNGKGMPSEALDAQHDPVATTSVGLRGMKERAQHLGGELVIGSDEHGTTITASLPHGEAPPAATRPSLALPSASP